MKYVLVLSLVFNLLYVFNLHKESDQQTHFDKATLHCLDSSIYTLIFDTEGNVGVVCKNGNFAIIDKDFNVKVVE